MYNFFIFILLVKALLVPNHHMYTFGGDGLTIYYDMIYHICHGTGQHFSGMNYPDGELIL